jgi:hypothetical protein
MNRGSSAPVLASVWAMKLAACGCTGRYSVVCSGRFRSSWSGAPSGALWGSRPTACTRGSRGGELGRSQAAHGLAIAPSGVHLRVPADLDAEVPHASRAPSSRSRPRPSIWSSRRRRAWSSHRRLGSRQQRHLE